MKKRPILFSAPMVRALLDGTKTQTRRVCKPAANLSAVVACQDPATYKEGQRPPYLTPGWFGDEEGDVQFFSPYGAPGDRLWVRENFAHIYRDNSMPAERLGDDVAYKADGLSVDHYAYGSWKPSIHMPRWASRITLEVTAVRVERLNSITRGDAMSEGCPFPNMAAGPDPRKWYADLWEQINGAGSWESNPWVWVLEFKRVEGGAA